MKSGAKYDYIAYTDGGYIIPKGIGASACVVLDAHTRKELYWWSKVCENSTSNRQELGAIIHTILSIPCFGRVLIYSDSQYAIGVLSGKMRGKLNQDLIEYFWNFCEQRRISVDFKWVQGHNGNHYNEVVDGLCTKAMEWFQETGERVRESFNLALNPQSPPNLPYD